jgi:hypothetical protein
MPLFMIRTGVVTRAAAGHDEHGDAKAWQDEDQHRLAGNQRGQRELDCIVECTRGGLFIVTRATIAIVLHHYPASIAVSLGSDHPHDS